MKKGLASLVALVALIFSVPSQAGDSDCKKKCDDKYDTCVKDAVEYGYDRVTAKAGCQEKRDTCTKKC